MPNDPPLNQVAVHTFRLTLAYDGTDFFGWQVQPGRRTVQGTLADCVREITGDGTLPQGSGRTDTGVHSSGQTVSLTLRANIPPERLHRALNRQLPPAVRVLRCEAAPADFHARANVLHKTYEYRIFERRMEDSREERICPPHLARFVWDCRWPLRLQAMQQAASDLTGMHDFTSFAASDPDRTRRLEEAGEPVNNSRTIFASNWSRCDGLLLYRVTGDGFLHHMVRNIVGTCVQMGAGRMPADGMPSILAAKSRGAAGFTAPPQGLHMMEVVYRQDQATADLRESANA